LVPKGFGAFLNNFVISKFFASWGAQTLQKTLTLEKFGFKLFSDFGKDYVKVGPSLQNQQAVALLMAVLGLIDQIRSFFTTPTAG
jgi:hypothetical protein